MGRKSALTPEQWNDIERRILVEGESVLSLATEYGVNESSIRRRIKPNKADKAERAQKHHPELREIALQKVEADAQARKVADQIALLPIAKQQIVSDLSRRLSNISEHLASAAEFGAATAHRLAGIAHAKVQEIDNAKPLDDKSLDSLRGVAALTKLANEASTIGVNLLAANKEALKELRERDVPKAQRVPVIVQDAGTDDAEIEEADANT